MKTSLKFWFVLCVAVVSAAAARAQPAVRHEDPTESLNSRWEWALERGRGEDGFWIGYSIDKLMDARSFIGSFDTWRGNERPTLENILGRSSGPETGNRLDHRSGRFYGNGFFRAAEDSPDAALELKEVGLLFYFERGRSTPSEIEVSNVTLAVDLKNRPVFWLGESSQRESVAHVQALYDELSGEEAREGALRAVGIHDPSPDVFSFLEKTLRSEASDDLREDAVFWIGQQNTGEALALLRDVLENDRSADVREKAVFSMGQMTMPEALESLIELAKNGRDVELRKKAIFWLGQKAAAQIAVQSIEEAIYTDADVEVQEHAVFALSQLPADESVPRLIEIATSHPSVRVRKKAIFWLGESGDPRSIELLISLVKTVK